MADDDDAQPSDREKPEASTPVPDDKKVEEDPSEQPS